MKFWPIAIAALVASAALLSGCGGSTESKSVPSDAVAVAGDQTVPQSSFDTLIRQQKLQYKTQKRPFPKVGSTEYKALRDQITAYLVRSAEFEQKAKEMGLTVTDKEVKDGLAKFKKQQFGGDEKKYAAARDAQGLTEQDVENNERLQLVTNKVFKKVTSDSKVTDKDVQKYYDSHKSQYVTQDSRTVRHILVKSHEQADKLYAQLKNGADFAKLAKKYSKDPGSATNGGQLTISKGQTVPEFEQTAFHLKTGEIARPIKTQFGWHIIEAVSPITKASFVPFAKVKASIKQTLQSTQQNDAMNKWVTGVQKEFCDGKISYAKGYQPVTDPCKPAKTTSGATAPATTTG